MDAAEWKSAHWWRVTLSDGTLWCETSDEREAREAFDRIRHQAVTVFGVSYERTYGPDPDAVLEHLWERSQREWRRCGVHGGQDKENGVDSDEIASTESPRWWCPDCGRWINDGDGKDAGAFTIHKWCP